MAGISEKDYRFLELKVQAEIKKVFSQFLEDLKNEPPVQGETAAPRELRRQGVPAGTIPKKTVVASPEPPKPRKAKKSLDINKILHRTSPAGPTPVGKILEEDMAKIFRKKHRRGSA